MRRVLVGILCCIVASLSSCNVVPDMVVMKDVNVNDWHEAVTLEFDNNTEQICDLNIMLHINSRFDAQQIALQIKMFSPDSLFHTEQVLLPSPVEWSKPTASSTDMEIPYRRNVSLRHKGKYIFEITPLEDISGVEAAGINFQANK